MTVTTELELRIAQDEFNFFRSQLAQSWLLALEAAILALITSPFINFVDPYLSKSSTLRGLQYHSVEFLVLSTGLSWICVGVQAFILVRLDKKEMNVPDRSELILKTASPGPILSKQAEELLAEIVRIRLAADLRTEAKRLKSRRDFRMKLGMFTLFLIAVMIGSEIAAEIAFAPQAGNQSGAAASHGAAGANLAPL
jgi:hypothetical protein